MEAGVYYFRRAVPDELRAIIGRTMVKQSLRTKDVAEAKRLAHPIAIADRGRLPGSEGEAVSTTPHRLERGRTGALGRHLPASASGGGRGCTGRRQQSRGRSLQGAQVAGGGIRRDGGVHRRRSDRSSRPE